MEIIVIFILTLLNGFFALSEISIISAKKSRIEQMAKEGNKNAQKLLEFIRVPEDFLSAVQVGITLIGIISGAYGGAALSDDMNVLLNQVPFLMPYADWLSIVLIIGAITYFSIVIGELIPKTIAMGNSDAIALFVAPIIKVFTKITMPFVKVLSFTTNGVIKLLGIKEAAEEIVSEEELWQIIKTAGKQGTLDRDESELHQNLFTYADQKAKSLMTHRLKIEWLNINDSFADLQKKIKQSAHSIFPVCEGEFNQVVGVVSVKDFYESIILLNKPLKDSIKPPIYIPETMLVREVFKLFKKEKQYLGFVVDEFGSAEGIITLHDILEAIVGDIPDIDETDEPAILKRADNSYLISGGVGIREINRKLKQEWIPNSLEDYTTLAGFIIFYLSRLPETGEKFLYKDYEIEIVDRDGIKIDKVLIRKVPA